MSWHILCVYLKICIPVKETHSLSPKVKIKQSLWQVFNIFIILEIKDFDTFSTKSVFPHRKVFNSPEHVLYKLI